MSFLGLMSNSPLLKSPVTIAREYFSSRLSDACKTSNISRQSVAFNVDTYCTGLPSLKEWGFYTLLLKSCLTCYRKIYCYSMRSLSFRVLQFDDRGLCCRYQFKISSRSAILDALCISTHFSKGPGWIFPGRICPNQRTHANWSD